MEATHGKRVSVQPTQNSSQWRAGKMRSYYTQLMPMHYVCQWLMRQGQANLSDYELALFRGAENIVVNRHGHFTSAEHLREAFESGVVEKIDIGPQAPGGNNFIARSLLAFDLDADDYELVFASSHDAGTLQDGLGVMTHDIWRVLVSSTRVLDHYLRHCVFPSSPNNPKNEKKEKEDEPAEQVNGDDDAMDVDDQQQQEEEVEESEREGVSEDDDSQPTPLEYSSMAVFSGRRGIHLWIFDRFRDIFNADEIHDLINKRIQSLQTALGAARFFNFMNRDADHIEQHEALLSFVEEYARDTLTKPALWKRGPATTEYLQTELSLLRGRPIEPSASYFEAMQQEESATSFWRSAGILLLAPRVDKNVTKGAKHLLKCPFSIHPSSLCVSIPFDLYEATVLDRAYFDAACIHLDDLFAPVAKRKASAHQRLSKAIAWFRWMHFDGDEVD